MIDKYKEHSSTWVSEFSQVSIKRYTKRGIIDWATVAFRLRFNIDAFESVIYSLNNGIITDAELKYCMTQNWMNQAMWSLIENCLEI